MSRKLVFDGQVFQTPAWHRGMGKYSLELIAALHELNEKESHWDEIRIVLSKRLPTESSVYTSLKNRAKNATVVELPLDPNEYDNRSVANRNRVTMDGYFSKSTEPSSVIDYIVLSIMQSEVAPAFSTLERVHNHLLFYDLIPLMFYKTYLQDTINQKGYFSKLAELLRADTYLAISKTVANDLSAMLGIDKNRILSIDGAPIAHGHTPKEIKVPRPFMLMPTGNDLRKNNKRGIEGFEIFNQRRGGKYHLLVTSVFQDFEVEELKKLSPNVVFTGNVSGEELEYLYQETSALLFPTEYEGLGLPILEALEKDKPVACSDISVFREISESAFSYFDPKDTKSIANALDTAVGLKTLPETEYNKVLDKFTWKRTARLFADFAGSFFKQDISPDEKPELALFSPIPDEANRGVELQQLHSELSQISKPYYYFDSCGKKRDGCINYVTQIADYINISHPSSIKLPKTELPIYFIENSANSAVLLLAALANPGILVLDDTDLKALWSGAIERNVIHETRLVAEKELNRSYKINGLIASLLATQKVIVVADDKSYETFLTAARKLPKDSQPMVKMLPRPAYELVYDELRPNFGVLDYEVKSHLKDEHRTFKQYAEEIVRMARLGEESE